MTELAHYRATRTAADTPARRVLRFLLQPAALGLLLALLAAALLGNWFHRQAAASLLDEERARIAILEGSALADFVAGKLAVPAEAPASESTPEDEAAAAPDPVSLLQPAILDWVDRTPDDDSIRVVRISGAQLLASTFPVDREGELPRRLTRDEKWLFDLGQELRAADRRRGCLAACLAVVREIAHVRCAVVPRRAPSDLCAACRCCRSPWPVLP